MNHECFGTNFVLDDMPRYRCIRDGNIIDQRVEPAEKCPVCHRPAQPVEAEVSSDVIQRTRFVMLDNGDRIAFRLEDEIEEVEEDYKPRAGLAQATSDALQVLGLNVPATAIETWPRKRIWAVSDWIGEEVLRRTTDEIEEVGKAPEIVCSDVVDILGLVDVSVTESEVQSWTPEQHELAVNWAGAVYLQANDNDDVEVPECPYFVPPDETSKRLAAYSKSEERQTWIVYICSHAQQAVGSMRLPDWDIPTIRRFAYQMFKDKLAKFPEFVVRCDR